MEAENGIISRQSKYWAPETIDRAENVLRAKGIKIFARVDQNGQKRWE